MAVKLNKNESVVDYLKSIGEDSSYGARSVLASSIGISNYIGSASQNTQMLNSLKSGSNTNPSETEKKADNVNKLKGVDDSITEKMLSEHTPSEESKKADKASKGALDNLESLTGKTEIISDSTWNDINSSFKVPTAVKEADIYLAQQLEKIQSGKTSYSDQVREMMDKIMNREKFSYDVDTDPLFQQALASAMSSGKQAMQDTIGQASALTGGYGSTYATGAGNQAYNAFIEDAYDNLPQYYQMAMEAYQMEGDEMYRQYGMLSTEDDKEYNRNVTAYDATSQYRNQLYNEAYSQYRDAKSDAFATANLELSEHGQLVSDAYNYYAASSDYSNKVYEREYNSWRDSVNQATQYAQLLNSDYWSQTNFDESVRQYEQSFAEEVRQYEQNFAEEQRQYNESLALNKQQHADQMAYNYAALAQDNAQFNAQLSDKGGSGSDGIYELTENEIEAIEKIAKNGGSEDDVINMLMLKGIVLTGEQDTALREYFASSSKSESLLSKIFNAFKKE